MTLNFILKLYSTVPYGFRMKVDVFENEHGRRLTPSCVAFTDRESLVGESAMMQMTRNPRSTILDAKALIGRSYEDAYKIVEERRWPYTLKEKNGKPQFQVSYRGQVELLYPEEIVAMILSQIKKIAEDRLQDEVTGAVITVPTSFNAAQRQAIADAATIACVPPVRLVNETVAAGVAFAVKEQPSSKLNVLMIHVGGGTFDATILAVSENECEMKGTDGDSTLGGDRYNDVIFEKLYKELFSLGGNNVKQSCKLRQACKKAKEELALSGSAIIRVDGAADGVDIIKKISEDVFDMINRDHTERIEQSIRKSLKNAKLDASQIDNVVFVGAGTRVHKIQKMITDGIIGIKKSKIRKTINVDEAPATGAAILAEILSSQSIPANDIITQDIVNYSIYLYENGNFRDVPIEGLRLPVKRLIEISGTWRNSLAFEIYAKGQFDVKEHKDENLGKFQITTLSGSPLPKVISVVIEITVDGLLEVSVYSSDVEFNLTKTTRIKEISVLRETLKKYHEDEEKNKSASRALHQLEKDLYEVKSLITKSSSPHRRDLSNECKRIRKLIDENSIVTMDITMVQEQLQNLRHQIENGKRPRSDKYSVAEPNVQNNPHQYSGHNTNFGSKLGANQGLNTYAWEKTHKSPGRYQHPMSPSKKHEYSSNKEERQPYHVADTTNPADATDYHGVKRSSRHRNQYATRMNGMGSHFEERYEGGSPHAFYHHASTPALRTDHKFDSEYQSSPRHVESLHGRGQGASPGASNYETRTYGSPTRLQRDRHGNQYTSIGGKYTEPTSPTSYNFQEQPKYSPDAYRTETVRHGPQRYALAAAGSGHVVRKTPEVERHDVTQNTKYRSSSKSTVKSQSDRHTNQTPSSQSNRRVAQSHSYVQTSVRPAARGRGTASSSRFAPNFGGGNSRTKKAGTLHTRGWK